MLCYVIIIYLMKYFIIYPVHLFENIDIIISINPDWIYLIEDDKYFNSFPFHKSKLAYHRASMSFYHDYLKSQGFNCKYIDSTIQNKYSWIKSNSLIWSYDPIDHELRSLFSNLKCKQNILINSLSFLESIEDLYIYQQTKTNGSKYFHDNSFYRWQRKRLGLLINDQGKPDGGSWSFDKANRNKFDQDYIEPKISKWTNEYWDKAKNYVESTFPDNFGQVLDYSLFPLTFKQNKLHLKKFISNSLKTFGTYEDGASPNIIAGSHSLLSTSLNVGLITPDYIITQIKKFYSNSSNKTKYIQQVEAFIRQVIGWRSYVRFVYEFHGQEMMKENYLGHNNPIPKSWFRQNPNTGFDFINQLISKAWTYGYLHHIERLMYIGNLLLITQTRPLDVYKWFMICFTDSYEWVMVPNVMGMSQYSVETIQMMTRPYFSSSAYIKRMSSFDSNDLNFSNDETYSWDQVWDGLYYNFISKHQHILKSIYATAPQVKNLNNLSTSELKKLKHKANLYLNTYGYK